MTNTPLISRRLLFALSLSISSTAATYANSATEGAPEANADEAKIMHWRMPQIGKEFWDIPELEQAYIETSPANRNDGIEVGKLGGDAGNKDLITALAKEIAQGAHGKYDSLLIAHNNKLLFESYFLRGRVNLPHPQSSATKVYISTVLGRAMQLGYLSMADLDKPIISFLKDIDRSKLTKGADTITLHDALTMRSGIRITEEQWQEHNKNPTDAKGQKLAQLYLEMSAPITKESQTFNYQNDPMLVMQVIEAVVPGSAHDFIKKEVMDKLDIDTYGWKPDEVSGLPGSSSMTSRAMLKIGMLAMNKGKWKGEQLIPEAFIRRAKQRLLYTGDDDIFGGGKDVSRQGYGYYWWGTDLHVGDYRYESASAQGGGGMYVLLVEELDLIIVATAHFRGDTTQQIIAERILPAFVP